MKIVRLIILSVALSACSFSASPSEQSFQQSEFVSMKGQASTEKETQISLDDGASISLPPNSIDGEATVNFERNPEKIKNLPPLPDGMVQLSDFYNFEIEGANLIGPVDLFIPVDKTLLPDQQGILFAMIPSGNSWKYIPVEIKDGKANIYTDELGDPLIAWRFTDPDWTDEEISKSKYICDPDISVQVIDNGDGVFQIIGQVTPPRTHLFLGSSLFERKPASNIPVSVTLNLRDSEPGEMFNATTDDNGNFELTIGTTNGIREGWNWAFVNAKCDPWFLEVSVESTGYAEFKYEPIVQNSTDAATEIPVVNPETIQPPKTPTENVLLPNVVSLPFDTAKEFLERIGYKVIWIDGKSNLEVGQVYSQAPKAGSITVPHRTTVVLYRTTEKVEPLTPSAETSSDWLLTVATESGYSLESESIDEVQVLLKEVQPGVYSGSANAVAHGSIHYPPNVVGCTNSVTFDTVITIYAQVVDGRITFRGSLDPIEYSLMPCGGLDVCGSPTQGMCRLDEYNLLNPPNFSLPFEDGASATYEYHAAVGTEYTLSTWRLTKVK